MITQEELKKQLKYDPNTGIFIRLTSNSNRIKVGDIAGGMNIGYLIICVNGKKYQAHRLAWLYVYGEAPKHQLDHINHDRSDNRILNLRCTTNQENHKNRTINKNNTSGIIGISWHKKSNKWQVRIMINGKDKYLGRFKDKFEAISARMSANHKYGFHPNHGANLIMVGD